MYRYWVGSLFAILLVGLQSAQAEDVTKEVTLADVSSSTEDMKLLSEADDEEVALASSNGAMKIPPNIARALVRLGVIREPTCSGSSAVVADSAAVQVRVVAGSAAGYGVALVGWF